MFFVQFTFQILIFVFCDLSVLSAQLFKQDYKNVTVVKVVSESISIM